MRRDLDDASLRAALARDVARALDPGRDVDREIDAYARSVWDVSETLIARLDEIARVVDRHAGESDDARDALAERVRVTCERVRGDYMVIDSVEDALRSAERACGALERALEDAERASGRGAWGESAFADVKGQFGAIFGRVGAITETWRLASRTGGDAPTSPTSPSGYYFDDDDERNDDSSGVDGANAGDVVRAKVSALAASANAFAGALAGGFRGLARGRGANASDAPEPA